MELEVFCESTEPAYKCKIYMQLELLV